MTPTTDAYPLAWPAGWPRTPPNRRRDAPFKVPPSVARDDLLNEVRMLGARNVVISANIPLRLDGLPRASFRGEPDDPGVCVYFELKGESKSFPCDRWTRVYDNIRAVGLSVAALRGLDRWGSGQMVDAAFAGFAALPETAGGRAWWDVLDVPPDASRGQIDAAYKDLARRTHPDAGGDADTFRALAAAHRAAKEATP